MLDQGSDVDCLFQLAFVEFRWDLVSSHNFEILAAQSKVVLEAKVDVNLFGL